jgi:GT2 family glycosyltransferase
MVAGYWWEVKQSSMADAVPFEPEAKEGTAAALPSRGSPSDGGGSRLAVDIVVPAYRNPEMTEACLRSLHACRHEIAAQEPRVIVIDDAPDDAEGAETLQALKAAGLIDELVANETNLGFVRSANRGFEMARRRGAALLLVNTDTVCFPGALREMVEVLGADGQIGFVGPRSNNATIATLPVPPHGLAGLPSTPERGHAAWQAVAPLLPRWHFVPTCVGFFLLVAPRVVADFGWFDEVFGLGYEEENELIRRASKVGFRAALANQAFVFHHGGASFALHEAEARKRQNLVLIGEMHPEYLPLVRRYQASPHHRAERQLGPLVPDPHGRRRVAFCMVDVGPFHNGTNESACAILRALDAEPPPDLELTVVCSEEAARFHGIDGLRHIGWTARVEPRYAVAVSFGQPFGIRPVTAMEQLAPVNVFGMLDTIAIDCGQISYDDDTEALWRHVAATADGVWFISRYARELFLNRFGEVYGAADHTCLFPTRLADYTPRGPARREAEHILVVGNHYPHKDTMRTARQLREAMPDMALTVIGSGEEVDHGVRSLRAGEISDEELHDAYARASVIVIPSCYEGFGMTLPKALAFGKPVVARDLPPTREILERYVDVSGVRLYRRNAELAGAVRLALADGASAAGDAPGSPGWGDWAGGMLDFVRGLVDRPDVFDRHRRRIERGDFLRASLRTSAASLTRAPRGGPSFLAQTMRALLELEGEAFVTAIYAQLLEREPDPEGFEMHVAALAEGASKHALIEGLLRSAEFRAKEG